MFCRCSKEPRLEQSDDTLKVAEWQRNGGLTADLGADSPAIYAGPVIPGLNDYRFHGEAPDVGAFEMKPAP